MRTVAPRQRALTDLWWFWHASGERQASVRTLRAPMRTSTPEPVAPLPAQDPTLPLYHDAQLW